MTTGFASTMSEAELQDAVIELATWMKYRIHHCRPALNRSGRWSTPIGGHAGFPDLVMVRDRVLFVELKSLTGRITRQQKEWMIALRGAGADYRLWTPQDWLSGCIEEELHG